MGGIYMDMPEIFCEKCGNKMIIKLDGNEDIICICAFCCRNVIKKIVNIEGMKWECF